MLANNETGVLQPVPEAAGIARAHGALVHCDAVQARGQGPGRRARPSTWTCSPSPPTSSTARRASGCLYVRRGTRMAPLVRGGGQERNRRAGTENVAGARGLRGGGRSGPRGPRDRGRPPRGPPGPARGRGCSPSREPCGTAASRGCRTRPTSRSRAPRPRRCSSPSTSRASRSPRAPPAPRAGSSRPTCCARWASRRSACSPRCASRSAAQRPRPTSTTPPTSSPAP